MNAPTSSGRSTANLLGLVALAAMLGLGYWLGARSGGAPDTPDNSAPATVGAEAAQGVSSTSGHTASTALAARPAPLPPLRDGAAPSPDPKRTELVSGAPAPRLDPRPLDNPGQVVPVKLGTLSADAVRAGINAARPAVSRCYAEALQRDPKLGGRLMVRMVVDQAEGKGRIREASIEDDASNEALRGDRSPLLGLCILKAVGEVEYPAPEGDGEIVVRFPYLLTNEE
jgi:hypothetical protein